MDLCKERDCLVRLTASVHTWKELIPPKWTGIAAFLNQQRKDNDVHSVLVGYNVVACGLPNDPMFLQAFDPSCPEDVKKGFLGTVFGIRLFFDNHNPNMAMKSSTVPMNGMFMFNRDFTRPDRTRVFRTVLDDTKRPAPVAVELPEWPNRALMSPVENSLIAFTMAQGPASNTHQPERTIQMTLSNEELTRAVKGVLAASEAIYKLAKEEWGHLRVEPKSNGARVLLAMDRAMDTLRLETAAIANTLDPVISVDTVVLGRRYEILEDKTCVRELILRVDGLSEPIVFRSAQDGKSKRSWSRFHADSKSTEPLEPPFTDQALDFVQDMVLPGTSYTFVGRG